MEAYLTSLRETKEEMCNDHCSNASDIITENVEFESGGDAVKAAVNLFVSTQNILMDS